MISSLFPRRPLIKPQPGDNNNVYGVIRSFADQEGQDAFYVSEQFRNWGGFIKPYVEPENSRRKRHGLETFFSNSLIQDPPKWKMGLVPWGGVWPSVYLAVKLLGPLRKDSRPGAGKGL